MQDKILEIAKSLELDVVPNLKCAFGGVRVRMKAGEEHSLIGESFTYTGSFNPYTRDADAFKVLEALRVLAADCEMRRWLWIDRDHLSIETNRGSICYGFSVFTFREAICEAYLELLSLIQTDTKGD